MSHSNKFQKKKKKTLEKNTSTIEGCTKKALSKRRLFALTVSWKKKYSRLFEEI